MDSMMTLLADGGYGGMLVAAFVAGSFLPFSSEAVMVGLLAAGLKPWPLLLAATIGNWAGSMFNYCVGRLGKTQWIERWLHVKPDALERAQRFLQGRGAMMGFFAFLPILGTAIAIALGLMRANPWITCVSIGVGKLLRYVVVMWSALMLI
ncbi:MAG: DedA family protein [Bacteroidaceae bacterium]|nr:DedA family protein [Bacteroidaceae bacterium]